MFDVMISQPRSLQQLREPADPSGGSASPLQFPAFDIRVGERPSITARPFTRPAHAKSRRTQHRSGRKCNAPGGPGPLASRPRSRKPFLLDAKASVGHSFECSFGAILETEVTPVS